MLQANYVINPTMYHNSSQTQDKDFRRTRTGLEGNVVFPAEMSMKIEMSSEKDSSHPFKGVGLISDIAGGCVTGRGGCIKEKGLIPRGSRQRCSSSQLLSLIINLVREETKYPPPY